MQQVIETSADPLVAPIVAEMRDLADRLCRLATVLSGDAAMVRGHFDELQSLDLFTQTQRALADLLHATGGVEERLSGVPLDAVADRLRDRLACAA